MAIDTSNLDVSTLVTTYLIPLGWKLAGAIALWIIGGWVINLIGNLSSRGMTRQKVEPTLVRYVEATLRVIMRIVLVIVILSVFGIETTSFAALLAAAGVAPQALGPSRSSITACSRPPPKRMSTSRRTARIASRKIEPPIALDVSPPTAARASKMPLLFFAARGSWERRTCCSPCARMRRRT